MNNRTNNCAIAQSSQRNFVQTCRFERDADLNMNKKKCCRKQRTQSCDKPKVTSEKMVDACSESERLQEHAPYAYQPPNLCGCAEDPFAALRSCAQKCMVEKEQLVEACGMKCPECPTEKSKSHEPGEIETFDDKREYKKEAKTKPKKVLK